VTAVSLLVTPLYLPPPSSLSLQSLPTSTYDDRLSQPSFDGWHSLRSRTGALRPTMPLSTYSTRVPRVCRVDVKSPSAAAPTSPLREEFRAGREMFIQISTRRQNEAKRPTASIQLHSTLGPQPPL
jgi:hypothetical protein